MGAAFRFENGCGFVPLGVRIPLLPLPSGVVEREDARLLIAKRRFEPCRRSFVMPPLSSGCDAGFSARKRGFESRRGFFSHLVVGERPPRRFREPETAGSTPAGQTCNTDPSATTKRGRGAAVLASLMSSRPWVRIPPAQFFGTRGRSSGARALACQAIGRRFESGRPRSWWLWCNGSIRGRDPRGTGSNPVGRPFPKRTA